ncbi:MAG TPA: hypothetical protein VGR97_08055 [Candidatus Acidoferrales bacterium]|nr:hypothetical protein [Candidatus Acidoferrales bacterium]
MRDLVDKYPEQFKKLGGIIYALNRIEISLITVLSIFFSNESDAQSEKNFIFNDALFDVGIFTSFETKLRLLEKVIKDVSRVGEEQARGFHEKKWLDMCQSIRKVQSLRNKLAHHLLTFSNDGKVGFSVRKGKEERLADQKAGKSGTTKRLEYDLDAEFEMSMEVCGESEKLLFEFLAEARSVLS